jgi:hypothetical protein
MHVGVHQRRWIILANGLKRKHSRSEKTGASKSSTSSGTTVTSASSGSIVVGPNPAVQSGSATLTIGVNGVNPVLMNLTYPSNASGNVATTAALAAFNSASNLGQAAQQLTALTTLNNLLAPGMTQAQSAAVTCINTTIGGNN